MPRSWPDTYSKWLQGIFLFLEEKGNAGLPVYLNAEDEDFDRIAQLGVLGPDESSIDKFVESIKETLNLDSRRLQDVFQYYGSMRHWKTHKYPNEVPPFLPILLLTVRAAELMRSDAEFRSSNYYGRLAEVLGIPITQKDEVGSSYRKYISLLWDTYNEWLAHNPQLGTPTAFLNVSQGYNDYVGVPIGQALLRSEEQATIESEFFERFFNFGGVKELIDNDEFIANLDRWIEGLSPQSRIQRIYGQAQEVLRIGIWELFERWQPRTRGDRLSGRKAGLRLVLRLSSGLAGRVVRLSLNANFECEESSSYEFEARNSNEEVISSLAQRDQYVGSGTFFAVESQIAEVLGRTTSVSIREGQEIVFSSFRNPRAITPFEVVVPGVWAEVSEMKLGETYALVVASESIELTIALLDRFGSGASIAAVSGLPSQWKLIVGFTPLTSLGAPDNLPLREKKGLQLSIVEGTRLPGGSGVAEYPLLEPPKFRVLQNVPGKRPILRLSGPGNWQREYDDLDEMISPDFTEVGEYVVRLLESAKSRSPQSYRRFILRDSTAPRCAPGVGQEVIGMRFGTDGEVVVSRATYGTDALAFVIGARLVSGELPIWRASPSRADPRTRDYEGDEEELDLDASVEVTERKLAACIIDPYANHLHKVFDQVPGRYQRYQRWVCTHCGVAGFVDTRKPKRRTPPEPRLIKKQDLPSVDPVRLIEHELQQYSIPHELIEERLWAMGGGNLREAASISELHPLNYVSQVLWNLAMAGHVDIVGMEIDLSTNSWRTAPLVLVPSPNGFRLVGQRSRAIIETLSRLVMARGGNVISLPPHDLSSVSEMYIHGIDRPVIESVLSALESNVGQVPVVDEQVSTSLLTALPPLSRIRDRLKTQSYFDQPQQTEYFDLTRGGWVPTTSVNLVGHLVRDAKYGMNYRFITAGNPTAYDAARCGYRLGKHLSAQANRVLMMNYDAKTREITVPLGAELPLLYSRAIVFRTGSLPFRRAGKVVYSEISDDTFEIMKYLMSE